MEKDENYGSTTSVFRTIVYLLMFLEIVMYVTTPEMIASVLGEDSVVIFVRLGKFFLFNNLIYSKVVTFLWIVLVAFATRNKKDIDFDRKKLVYYPFLGGIILLVLSVVAYMFTEPTHTNAIPLGHWMYILLTAVGTPLVLYSLDNIAKYIKDSIGKDPFNLNNERFEQNTELVNTPYSVNIPMRFYSPSGKYKKGWINITNPFRGTWVVGTPGSGKSYSVIEPFITQHSAKGFSMVVYDYKFPALAQNLYYNYLKNSKNKKLFPKGCKFSVINFDKVEYSSRVNPIQLKYIPDSSAALETAETLIQSLQKGGNQGGGNDDFFKKSAVNFLAAIIFFFCNYEKEPYDANKKKLFPDKTVDPDTGVMKATGIVRDAMGNIVTPAYWLGKYSDMPHVLSFLNQPYDKIFETLLTDPETVSLIMPFKTAFENGAMEQLEGMVGTLRIEISRLATKEAYWVFDKAGDDFDLKVSDPNDPSYLVIANNPEKESITGALNALILNRLVTRVNTGHGKNVPVSIIVDELPTLYFHKIDRLIGTARSNKVAVALGFQELPQLEGDYGKNGMEKVITTVGNVICGSARAKETLDWISTDIMGQSVQIKKGITVDREHVSVNINEEQHNLLPASKIADMPTGWLCGQTARDFVKKKNKKGDYTVDILEAEEFKTTKFFCATDFDKKKRDAEEDQFKQLDMPIFYNFGGDQQKEQTLFQNMARINKEVEDMIIAIQQFAKKD